MYLTRLELDYRVDMDKSATTTKKKTLVVCLFLWITFYPLSCLLSLLRHVPLREIDIFYLL